MQPSKSQADQYLTEWWARNEQRVDEYVEVEGVRVFVPRGVFSPEPNLTNSSRQLVLALPDRLDGRALDVGTGCGIIAIHLAKRGADVTATDYDPNTLPVANQNAIANGIAHKIKVMESDLLESVTGHYSLVVANLPIVDVAWHGLVRNVEAQMQKFFTKLPDVLSQSGRCLFAFASFGDEIMLNRLLAEQPLSWRRSDESRFGVTWSVYELSRR